MNTHPIEQEELMAYLDGELSTDRAATAATHLEQCRECQGLAADIESVSRRMRNWQVESAKTIPGIATTLDERPRSRRTWRDVLRVRRVSPWILGLAGLFVVALLVSPHMWLSHKAARAVMSKSRLQAPGGQQAQRGSFDALITKNPMIVRTAQLSLIAKDFDRARANLEDILKRHKGYLGQLNSSAPIGAGRILETTLRVPGDQLEAAMSEIKKLGRVESESQTGEEVTQQYIDLEARLSNARNAEQRLTDLLRQRTGKLSDVLAVEVEIDKVRGEIERMEAERKSLANRVGFATLNVKIEEDYKAQLQVAPDSTLTRFRNAAVEGYTNMAGSIVDLALLLLSYGPTLLIWGALLFFPGRIIWRRLWRGDTSLK